MLIVRKAQFEDFAAMLRMAKDFVAEHPHGVDLSEDAFRGLFETALPGHPLAMWVANRDGQAVGMMGALNYPLFFNPVTSIAQELFLWVDVPHRGHGVVEELIAAFEGWAQRIGAGRVLLTAPHSGRIEAVQRMYGMSGYAPLERTFYKDI